MKFSQVKKFYSIKFNYKFEFKKDISFGEFESYIRDTDKLASLIKGEGLEKIKSDLEQIQKGLPKDEPLRYIDYNEFNKYQQKLSDQKGKFMMPLGWGWVYPVIKYSALFLVSVKTQLCIPWMSFFIVTALVIRAIMLPLMVRQMILIHRMAKVKIIIYRRYHRISDCWHIALQNPTFPYIRKHIISQELYLSIQKRLKLTFSPSLRIIYSSYQYSLF
jgi:membrane protein insertase Oxa1/YidC/SpoIIIJ